MHRDCCEHIKGAVLKVSTQGEEGWGEEPLHKASTTSQQGSSNLIFPSVALFYQEPSGL